MSTVSTFGTFTMARLGIYVSQRALDVVGNNISNINTEGYTRQRHDQVALHVGGADMYHSRLDLRIGSGAIITGVSQLRDPYLDIRYRDEMARVGSADAKLAGLEKIASIIDEVGKGGDGSGNEGQGVIEAQFNDLVEQMQNLVTQGAGRDEFDTLLRSSATSLCDKFQAYATKFESLMETETKKFHDEVDEVNDILQSIRNLNSSIRKSEIHGAEALEQKDERNLLIDKLAEFMDIDVTYEDEDLGGGVHVDKLVIKLAGHDDTSHIDCPDHKDPATNMQMGISTNERDKRIAANRATLIDGVYGTQLSIQQVPERNPDYNPNAAKLGLTDPKYTMKYLKKDPDPDIPDDQYTNDETKAEMVEDDLLRLQLSPLINKDGDIRKTITLTNQDLLQNPDPSKPGELITGETVVPKDPLTPGGETEKKKPQAILEDWIKLHPDDYPTTRENPDGSTSKYTYSLVEQTESRTDKDGKPIKVVTGYMIQRRDVATSGEKELYDNTLYGALQSQREFLTEAGEFSEKSIVDAGIDPNAASKRGIPYYVHTLDALAQQFANILNDANEPIKGVETEWKDGVEYFKADPDKLPDATLTEEFLKKKSDGKDELGGMNIDQYNTLTDSDEQQRKTTKVDGKDVLGWVFQKVDADGKPILKDGKPDLQTQADKKPPADGTDATTSVDYSWAPYPCEGKGLCKKEGGILISNGATGDDPTGITASNISISKQWGTGEVRVRHANDINAPSTANENFCHILAQLSTTDHAFTPNEVMGADKNNPATFTIGGEVAYYKGTLQGHLSNTWAVMSHDTTVTTDMLQNYTTASDELYVTRDSVSGVDLNDETMSMMQYQKSYSAACRLLTTIDEMIDRLVNNTGRVGL